MNKVGAVSAAAFLLGAGTALAQENDGGLYLGAACGDFSVQIDRIDDIADVVAEDEDESAARYFVGSAGVGITLFERLNLSLEYEVIDVESFDDADAAWISAAWRL